MSLLSVILRSRALFCRKIQGIHKIRCSSTSGIQWEESRFNGITIDLNLTKDALDSTDFSRNLEELLSKWKLDGKRGVWLKVPAHQSHLIQTSIQHGFTYHHAMGQNAVLITWLPDGLQSKLPRFATHQVGVSGVVVDEETRKVVVIKDRKQQGWTQFWKFPGGLSDFGEYIGETAVREVWEETGIKTEFKSLLMFRQAHHLPFAFDQSDLYVICRLKPLTFEINKCEDEIDDCKWMDIDQVVTMTEDATPLCNLGARLALYGLQHGFDKVDIVSETMSSWVYRDRTFQVYHRPISGES